MADPVKPLYWCGSTKRDLDICSDPVRQNAGLQLHLIQQGKMPMDWKALPSVGSGVFKIRLDDDCFCRALYVAVFEEAVYVLHCFQAEATTGTGAARNELQTVRWRYREVVQFRKKRVRSES